jgi:phage tail sheath protein FI
MPMATQVSYPGVYVEEFAPGAPIQGVSTSTTALVGVASDGELNTPTLVTSWDAFTAAYGARPVPGFYLWHAVNGFFQNGGQLCYVVRASNGSYGSLTVQSDGGTDLFTVRARQPGKLAISAGIARQHLLTQANTSIYRLPATAKVKTTAAVGGTQVTVPFDTATHVRPGDTVRFGADPTGYLVARITLGTTDGTLQLAAPLVAKATAGDAVQFADSTLGASTFRLQSTDPEPLAALVTGAMLTFSQAGSTSTQVVDSVIVENLRGGDTTYRVTLRAGLEFAVDMGAATKVQSEEFSLSTSLGASTTVYDKLALDPSHPNYYVARVAADPGRMVTLVPVEPPAVVPMTKSMPAPIAPQALAPGAQEDLTLLQDGDFLAALDALQSVAGVNLVACPDRITPTVQQAMVQQCELLADRFAVLDCAPGQEPFNPPSSGAPTTLQQRAGVTSTRGYAALYFPWLRVPPPGAGEPILVPPSGHVCGLYARVDAARGVFKAPANETVFGAVGVERVLSDIDHGQLNLAGVDAIRVFQSGGLPLVFGARTTASDRNWQYVNIRRLFLYLEGSIQQGIQWAVFEPNNLALWQKLKRSIGDFLEGEWRAGALFGARAEDAFYVRIDDVLNPFSEQQLGRLHIEIGVRPSYPAEFIVVRIGIWPGGALVTES